MKSKYNLTAEQNIFLAKRNLVDYIYNSAKLEGCNVTFPETQTILEGINIGSVTLDDIQTILNLRDAWRFVLSDITAAFDLAYICRVNEYVSRNESLQWGALRTGQVGISGTDYKPPIPDSAAVAAELERIDKIESSTERAITFFLWACRAQLFWDGNKRTSTVCANKILIAAGAGILTVRGAHMLEFNKRLLEWYNSGDRSVIDHWLYENCIDGIT
ncbi:MAG: Fic family protein [Spirochaetia bacterium]|jgi:Fic family protein|nr:Fic family protein [Spirochaetia bacterium]